MSITVDPGFVPPPPPTTSTSSDGYLTATTDPAHAGVSLKADFSSLVTVPDAVRFERTDGTRVRSGDPAQATNGVAYAYDHEATLDDSTAWVAIPLDVNGVEGAASAPAALSIPGPADASDAWLKSTGNPDASVLVRLALADEDGRGMRPSIDFVTGEEYPVASWDVPTSLALTVTVRTNTRAEYNDIVALVKAGPMLLQAGPACGIPDDIHVLAVGSLKAERLAETGFDWRLRHWSLQLQAIARPDTTQSPLRIPGNTCAGLLDGYPTCADVLAQVATCADLIGV